LDSSNLVLISSASGPSPLHTNVRYSMKVLLASVWGVEVKGFREGGEGLLCRLVCLMWRQRVQSPVLPAPLSPVTITHWSVRRCLSARNVSSPNAYTWGCTWQKRKAE
jgi:hypothetical protein